MQVGLERALRQENPTSSLHRHFPGCAWGFTTARLQLLLFPYKATHFSQIPARRKYSEECGRAHSTSCPEPWPPLGDEPASSLGPQKLRDADTSRRGPQPLLCFHALIQSHVFRPLLLFLQTRAWQPTLQPVSPTKVDAKSMGAISIFRQSRVATIIKKRESQPCYDRQESTSALSRARCQEETVKPHCDSFSDVLFPSGFHDAVPIPLPHVAAHRDTFLFLTQLPLWRMAALPYGTTRSAPSGSIKLMLIVFTPHSGSQTLHQEHAFHWPVPPRVLHWEYTYGWRRNYSLTAGVGPSTDWPRRIIED